MLKSKLGKAKKLTF